MEGVQVRAERSDQIGIHKSRKFRDKEKGKGVIRAVDLQSFFTNMERGLNMYYHRLIAKNRENSKLGLGR